MSFLSWVLCDLLFPLLNSFIVSIFFLDIRGTVELGLYTQVANFTILLLVSFSCLCNMWPF